MTKRRANRGASIGGILIQLLPPTLLSLLFASVGIVHVTSRVLVVHAAYQISQLEAESRTLVREHDQLSLERATLVSPARLERIARETLDLAPPAAGSVIAAGHRKVTATQLDPKTSDSPRDSATAVRVAGRVAR